MKLKILTPQQVENELVRRFYNIEIGNYKSYTVEEVKARLKQLAQSIKEEKKQ